MKHCNFKKLVYLQGYLVIYLCSGPRFVMETIRIFDGSFEGAVLYDNPDYESPNAQRRALKMRNKGKTIERELHHKVESLYSLLVLL